MSASVTFKGDAVALAGPELKVGDKAPDFSLQAIDMSDVTLTTDAGSARIVAVVPSLDTSVCSKETKSFNDAAKSDPSLNIYSVSCDLPFAMKRWCAAEGVENVKALSDHRTAAFGEAYGVKIDGGPLDRVLCRAVFVIGADDTLKHVEYCSEIAEEPDYDAAIAAAKG
ncbi:thiol peroxidase [Alienimonas chondri]|uniref:Thiol peroxidase n=1 Tax=Alienimonas chondri TaxID=2681879 RepID=A0ABX1V9H8_9PLAN|nr:thiol peroxidase [Alienimonas chondri]NNJ24660.1 Thiol peroxidase [Alienimonas chondri]